MPPGGGDGPPRGGVADWGLARVVEQGGVAGSGGATVHADAVARAAGGPPRESLP